MISKSSDAYSLDEQYLKRHFMDLAKMSYEKGITMHSRFLSEAEQSILDQVMRQELGVDVRLDGGHLYAERKMAGFYPRGVRYDTHTDSPFCVLCIQPKNQKFAEGLTHRDVLGTLMGLSLERSCIGDILFLDHQRIIVFVIASMAPMIIDQLDRIRHTSVECFEVFEDTVAEYQPTFREKTGSVASLRIDAAIAMVYDESRSKLAGLFPAQRVFINSRLCTRPDQILKETDIVSVRGFGRFRFDEVSGSSKKGRTIIKVSIFESILHV